MLDKLFLNHISSKSKKFYWIGQILLIALMLGYCLAFKNLSLSLDKDYLFLMALAIGIVLIWGVLCILIWPIKQDLQPKKKENSLVN